MTKTWFLLLCTHILLHTHVLEKKRPNPFSHLVPTIINFDQESAYTHNVSFKKPLSVKDFNKIINSYNIKCAKKCSKIGNYAIEQKINVKKKKLTYTLAFRY